MSPEGLEAVRQGFLALVPRLGAQVVDASAPPEQVRDDVVARIRTHHRHAHGSTGSAARSPVRSSTRATGDPALTRSANGAPCVRTRVDSSTSSATPALLT